MSGIQIGLLLFFILVNLLLILYIWLYRKRTNQSKKLIGISAPEVPKRFLDVAFLISNIVLIMTVIFLLLEITSFISEK